MASSRPDQAVVAVTDFQCSICYELLVDPVVVSDVNTAAYASLCSRSDSIAAGHQRRGRAGTTSAPCAWRNGRRHKNSMEGRCSAPCVAVSALSLTVSNPVALQLKLALHILACELDSLPSRSLHA